MLMALFAGCDSGSEEPGIDPQGEEDEIGAKIDTFAGSLPAGYSGDGGSARDAKLGWLTALSIDSAQNLYVTDGSSNTVRKINTSNVITTIVGKFPGFNVTPNPTHAGDGGPATAATIMMPLGATVDRFGNIYISDTFNQVIRMVDRPTGRIWTIAGKPGTGGYAGDDGPATKALMAVPHGMATDRSGNLYFADTQNHVVRKIWAGTGQITTIAGIPGEAGYTGDDGPATRAKLSRPTSIMVGYSGQVYFTDNNSVIRLIEDGRIKTIAGTGVAGFSGDGGKATEAQLRSPKGMAFAKDGSLVFCDAGNNRIRSLSPERHIITTIAGTGEAGYDGDGGLAINAKISDPVDIVVDRKGNIYVAEAGNGVVRIIKPVE